MHDGSMIIVGASIDHPDIPIDPKITRVNTV
jgi:hypothetical protein